jgi:uncharacterized membrane-anchored protein YhcB (DUF1043 family)
MFTNLWVWIGIALVAVGAAAVVGYRSLAVRRRLRDVEARAEAIEAAREQAVAEAAARQEEAAALQRQLESYRAQVVDHFSGTWDLMRALVLRYRADFEELAEGESPPWEMALVEPARNAPLPATSESKKEGGKAVPAEGGKAVPAEGGKAVPAEGGKAGSEAERRQPPGAGGAPTSASMPGSAGSSSRQRSWTGS